MGEAKQRKAALANNPVVYHHTSTLRTNLIWMSGVIEVEGAGTAALHPRLGIINSNANLRRDMRDFGPLAWFTTQIEPPQCLIQAQVYGQDKETGERVELPQGPDLAKVIALQRVALGFPIASVPVRPWCEHEGYATDEGRVLNESARDFGDDPDHWYVADKPVDVLQVTEFWAAASVFNPKLRRHPEYLPDLRRMVERARNQEGVFIPPTWLKPEEAQELIAEMKRRGMVAKNVPVSIGGV